MNKKTPRPEIIARLHELRFTRYLNSSMLPTPEKGHCKWCGGKAARVWCCEQCREDGYVRMGYVEGYLFRRDKGICAKCGLDTMWLKRQIRMITKVWRRGDTLRMFAHFQFQQSLGWAKETCRRLWDADHIIAVSEGGGCCGLDNFQTLCVPCHKKESAILAKKRAARKKVNP